ncbi:expressed protein [Echinococcus multilocularis]|uniref:Expressed protein n=1 Tax=Echinococcus multilocularis TaxID=6211 RepID=A0A068YL77_ECHMU|nr:expressed protein [Echinococcus multilocularis]
MHLSPHVISQDASMPTREQNCIQSSMTYTLTSSDNQPHCTCLLCTYTPMLESYAQPTEPPHHVPFTPYSTSW